MSDTIVGQTQATTTTATTQSWRDTLPDDLKNHGTLSKFNDVTSVAKGYVELEKMRGVPSEQLLILPKDATDKDGWSKVHARLGRPETPDKYSPVNVKLPDGFEIPKEEVSKALATFHEAGLTDAQAQKVLGLYFGGIAQGAEAETSRKAQEKAGAEAELRKEYGDKYDGKLSLLNAVLGRFGSAELVDWAEKSGAGNNAAFVRALVKVGETLMEDSSTGGLARGSAQNLDPRASAVNQIEQLKIDKNFMEALMVNTHSGHQAALNQWTMLHRTAYSK